MIELPRACLVADRIAAHADFFSFGTNDLTQTTAGLSRDDAEGGFLNVYLERGLLDRSPFESLDTPGVGALVEIAVERGREAKPGPAARDLRRARRRPGEHPLLRAGRSSTTSAARPTGCRSRGSPPPRRRSPPRRTVIETAPSPATDALLRPLRPPVRDPEPDRRGARGRRRRARRAAGARGRGRRGRRRRAGAGRRREPDRAGARAPASGWVSFFAHLDTVPEAGRIEVELADGVFRSRGETILGADNKAAVAVLVELAARHAAPRRRPGSSSCSRSPRRRACGGRRSSTSAACGRRSDTSSTTRARSAR